MKRVAPLLLSLALARGAPAVDIDRLKALTLEDLANVPVSIASRVARPVRDTAAAVYVITREDIRRSPAESLPDLLREVPGLDVGRIDANTWAVGIRGFNGRYANKLLVLVDGRSVYASLFSGVLWGLQDLLLEDIERIEVIRGPGASVWGANAVNGVINIITRSSEDTHGNLVTLTAGEKGRYRIGARHGGALGDRADYRFWVQQHHRRDGTFENGDEAYDHALDQRLGFRIDGLAGDDDSYSLIGGVHRAQSAVTVNFIDASTGLTVPQKSNSQSRGGYLIGRWRHARDEGGWSLQLYYDHQWYDATNERERAFDIEFQDERLIGGDHQLTWGLGYRWLEDDVGGQPGFLEVHPPRNRRALYSLFAEDEIQLADHWRLNLSARAEYSTVSDADLQASARLLWKPRQDVTWWGALSRASRIPAVAERGVFAPVIGRPGSARSNGLPVVSAFIGNPDFDAENMTSLELGYRHEWSRALSLDVSAFFYRYEGLRSIEPGTPELVGDHLLVPLLVDDRLDAWSRGLELSLDWRFSQTGRLRLNGSLLDLRRELDPESGDIVSRPGQNNAPEGQFNLLLSTRPATRWSFDARLRYVGGLPADTQRITDYWALDMQLRWDPAPGLSIALKARNLFDNGRIEFHDELNQRTTSTQEGASYSVNLEWSFD